MPESSHQIAGRSDRAGVSTVELAVCLPVVLLLVIGCIECSGMIFVKQTLSASAYEGVRVAINPDAKKRDVVRRCKEVLKARNVKDATIQVVPANLRQVRPGEKIEVKVTAPSSTNRFIPAKFVNDVTITSNAIMLKE
jgi:Flp pilus assembly protein TadG